MTWTALTAAAVCPAWAQTRLLPRPRSPVEAVPKWRDYSAQNPPPAKRYVFFDEAAEEYVVLFPESLQTGASGGGMQTFRFRPQFVVEPQVSATLTRLEDGAISYEYELTNGLAAKDAIRWFYIVVPLEETPRSIHHDTWRVSRLQSTGKPVAPQAALVRNEELRDPGTMGRFLFWNSSDTAPPIEAGATLGGYRVVSNALPGITTAYAATGKALRPPFEIPPEVMDQIAPLLLIENNYKALVTVGPKFRSSEGVARIAQDYRKALSHLTENGWLDAGSGYVRELTALLDSAAQAGRRSPIDLRSAPRTSLERSIGAAIALALGSESR